jgi:hypothetical protein
MRSWHLLVCVGLIAVALLIVALGGGSAVLIPAIGCAAMMGVMVWMMMRGGSGGPR